MLLPFLGGHEGWQLGSRVVRVGIVGAVIWLFVIGRRHRWHEQWIDYRLLAELLRHLRMLAPLGGGRALPSVPVHWTIYGDPAATWMAWYVRAVERALGLVSARVDPAYLHGCAADLQAILEEQKAYHDTTARIHEHLEHRLHYSAIVLFMLTFVLSVLYLFGLPSATPGSWLKSPLTFSFFEGFLPAAAAALTAINYQGEFRRVARRSRAMRDHLQTLLRAVADVERRLDGGDNIQQQVSSLLYGIATQAGSLFVNEVLDWRVVLLDQPLRPPG